MEKGVRMETAEGKMERLNERPPDAARDRLVISRVRPARDVQRGDAADAREVDGVTGVCGELLQIRELRTPLSSRHGST